MSSNSIEPCRIFEPITSTDLSPLFWLPSRMGVASDWYGHVPFAHWLVSEHKPGMIVELGTRSGVSYSAWCEAILRNRLAASAMAVCHWRMEPVEETVLQEFQRFHNDRYAAFSTLNRSGLDEALGHVADGSIDLLHLDGRHTYADVLSAFTSWHPKLSSSSVVVLHSTNVRGKDFGVWRLWSELRRSYPGFEFLHGRGLGILAVGPDQQEVVKTLCHIDDERAISAIRLCFASLGERWTLTQTLSELRAKIAEDSVLGKTLPTDMDGLSPSNASVADGSRHTRSALAMAKHALWALNLQFDEQRAFLDKQRKSLDRQRAAYDELNIKLLSAYSENALLRREVDVIRSSTSWRITAPLRGLRSLRSPRATGSTEARANSAPMDYASGTNQVSSSPEFVEVDVLFLSGQPYTIGHDYRVDRYVQAARGCGLTVRWMDVASLEDVDIGRVKMLVIRRAPLNPGLLHVIDAARNGGAVILFDVDDLVFRPDLAESDLIDGPDGRKLTQEQTQELFLNMLQTLSNSDLVTCPTKELANHARRLGRPAFVLPDGFDEAWHSACRLAHRKQLGEDDGIIRIGYAAGSRMQQRDFAGVVESIARVLAENPNVRLVLFRDHSMQDGMATADEFPALKTLESQIEWRDLVPLTGLPAEIARFSINIVPLEKGNPLCESRSEVKFLEAALAGVPTIATATAPLLRAVAASSAGILAQSTDDWYAGLSTLIRDGEARRRLAQDAYHVSLAHFSPRQCLRRFKTMWDLTRGGELAAAAFQRNQYEEGQRRFTTPRIPGSTCLFMKDRLGQAAVTVIIPVYNYADYALEALQSVAEQTLDALDLVVVDDCSTDDSVAMILAWLRDNHTRFNRCVLLRHCQNMGLGPARNSGFAAAETRHVLPLDADNRLRRNACQMLLEHLDASPAGFAYPSILKFGDEGDIFGTAPFSILKLQCGNYIDAMALIRKEAWAASGGYDNVQYGWEDFDFWCRLIEGGWFGMSVGHVLAEYRVHGSSMLRTTTDKAEHREYLRVELTRRHPWLELPVTEEASPTIAD